MSRRAKAWWIVGALALIASASAIVMSVAGGGPDARGTAERYLSALAAGDTQALATMTSGPEDALAAFDGAAGYLQDPQITEIRPGRDGLTAVRARGTMAGSPVEIRFVLSSADDDRRAAEFLAVARVSASFGAPVRVGVVMTAGDIALFPAVYEITPASAILTGGATVAVSSGIREVAVEFALAPDAAQTVQPQLDAYAHQCTQGGSAIPPRCGIRIPWAADLAAMTSVAFRVEELPRVEISPDARSFAATGGVLVATVTGTTRGGETASVTYRTEDWSLRGSLSFDGADTVLTVR